VAKRGSRGTEKGHHAKHGSERLSVSSRNKKTEVHAGWCSPRTSNPVGLPEVDRSVRFRLTSARYRRRGSRRLPPAGKNRSFAACCFENRELEPPHPTAFGGHPLPPGGEGCGPIVRYGIDIRASRTASTNFRALEVITSRFASRRAFASTSSLPAATAAAPALMNSGVVSRLTPPVGRKSI